MQQPNSRYTRRNRKSTARALQNDLEQATPQKSRNRLHEGDMESPDSLSMPLVRVRFTQNTCVTVSGDAVENMLNIP